MKKTLLLLASAALLLVGCAKDQLSNGADGGMTTATFTANVDGGVVSKAVVDGDGNGAKVNRCIMEIYFQDELYQRLEESTNSGAATFNVPVVAGKQYSVLFWADCGEGLVDKYYTTKTAGADNKGLKAVAIKHDAFIGALAAGKNDELDAFFFADNYTVPQGGGNYSAKLKRPFAQLNVITTDVGAGKTVVSESLLPDTVSVCYTAGTIFNVADSTVTGSTTYKYSAPVYGTWSDTKTELTLSMDYILASTEQGAVDVTFVTKNGDQPVMTHALNYLPYKRNYRTNVKGDLLTVAGNWTATIDSIWGMNGDGGEINHIIASSYTDVVSALQSGNQSKNLKVTVTPAAIDVTKMSDKQKQDVIKKVTIDGQQVDALRFILYEEKTEGKDAHPASPAHVEFELPARPAGVAAWKIEYEPAYPTETVVVSTKKEDNANVIIEAPKSTVTLDATKINSVVSTTSENTLIIPQGLELKNLEVKMGAVEYHGTGLEKVKVSPIEGANVYFKTSEGLANTDAVYGVVKDHIADGFAITKESESTWKIVPEVCKIGTKSYASLIDAVAAVQNGETIEFVKDVENAAGISINTGKTFIIDFGGHKYTVNKPGAGSTDTQTAAFQLIKGQTITLKNGTIEAAEDNLTEAVAPAKNIKRMFQSYANVNFENMKIDGANLYGENSVIEFACGNVSISGSTSISAKEGVKAINVDTWKDAYPAGTAVSINTTGAIGDIYLFAEGTGEGYTKSSLTIKKGSFATITDDGTGDWSSAVSGGTFTADPTKYLAPKCEAVLGGDGLYHVNKVYDCTATIELPNGEVKEFNSGENNSGVMDAINYLDFTLYTDFPATDYPGYVPVIKMHKDDVVWNTHVKTSSPSKYGSCTYQKAYTSVLDGQGHTLTSKKVVPEGYKVSTTGVIKLMGGANVTIRDLIVKTTSANTMGIDVVNNSVAVLEKVTVNVSNTTHFSVTNNASTVYIKDCIFDTRFDFDNKYGVSTVFQSGGPYILNSFQENNKFHLSKGTSYQWTAGMKDMYSAIWVANWEDGAICYCTNDYIFHIDAEIPSTEEVTAQITYSSTNAGNNKTISYCGDKGLENLFKFSNINNQSIVIYKTSSATRQIGPDKYVKVTFEGDAVYNNNFTASSGYHIVASEPVGKTITYSSVAN